MVNFFRPQFYAMKVDPTLKYAWINIPKNASSFVQKALDDNKWNDVPDDLINSIAESPNIKKLVVLRDPVERWISGFAECWADHDNILDLLDSNTFYDTVQKNPVYDDHTEYQHRFIGKAQNLQYIYMQKNGINKFYKLLGAWIKRTGGFAEFDNYQNPTNPASNNPNKVAIVKKLSAYCKQDNNISNLHKKDYELLEQYEKFTN
jgi:hypothetical protein|tara:strand:+ start:71 stop:685 length:615 start_codon:yes stop_codon:yes gene_type:complete